MTGASHASVSAFLHAIHQNIPIHAQPHDAGMRTRIRTHALEHLRRRLTSLISRSVKPFLSRRRLLFAYDTHTINTQQKQISEAHNKQCAQTRDGTLVVMYAYTRARTEGSMRMCTCEKVEERVRFGQHDPP